MYYLMIFQKWSEVLKQFVENEENLALFTIIHVYVLLYTYLCVRTKLLLLLGNWSTYHRRCNRDWCCN